MSPKIVCPILAKELQDFHKGTALIQKVEIAIKAREDCIKQIEAYSTQYFSNAEVLPPSNEQIDTVVNLLTNLRHLTIYTVE